MKAVEMVRVEADRHSSREKVESVASDTYWALVKAGFRPCIVNDRYLEVEGVTYQFIRVNAMNTWKVKQIFSH